LPAFKVFVLGKALNEGYRIGNFCPELVYDQVQLIERMDLPVKEISEYGVAGRGVEI
jgi:hypothetical protein